MVTRNRQVAAVLVADYIRFSKELKQIDLDEWRAKLDIYLRPQPDDFLTGDADDICDLNNNKKFKRMLYEIPRKAHEKMEHVLNQFEVFKNGQIEKLLDFKGML